MNNKKIIFISILSVISILLITMGVTLAFFSYSRYGSTENTVESGSINFIYEEVNKMGNGISITDAMPVSDTEGKASNNYFDFKISSTTGTTIAIPYEITTRVVDGSDDISDYVKLYLTKVNGNSEQQVALSMYNNLNDSTNPLAQPFGDKTLYNSEVLVGSTNYVENYRLRMWLNNDTNDGNVIDYSPVYACTDTQYTNQTDCESNDEVWKPTSEYNNQGKTFSIKINVYANGEQASQEKILSANSTGIRNLKVNNSSVSEDNNSSNNYDFYKIVEDTVTQANIEIETVNPNATITVENITGTAINTNVQRLATVKLFNLIDGENFFRITVTSENKLNTESYILKVRVGEEAGLYDSTGKQIATWSDLVAKGMNNTTCANGTAAVKALAGSKTDLKLVIPKTVVNLAGSAFTNDEKLKEVVLPKGLKTIGNGSFSTCKALVSVNIPNTVTSIDRYAFRSSSKLASITMPTSVTSIGLSAFDYCTSLKTLTIPAGSTTTPVFKDTGIGTNVTTLNLPSSLKTIPADAFNGFSKLTALNIPSGVTSIGADAFKDMSSVKTLKIPDSVTSIGDEAFYNAYGVTSLTISKNIKSIGTRTFSNLSNLTSVTIPSGVTSIGNYAFMSCSKLTSVTIPNTVKTIGQSAFSYCSKLATLTIPSSVTTINASAFHEASSLANVTFSDPNGWKAGSTALTLTNTATNATYLKSTYKGQKWTKGS